MTTTEILRRCCEAPEAHLAELTFAQFQAYELGYRFGGLEMEDFDEDVFMRAVKEDYGVQDSWPFNVATTGFLVAVEGDQLALARYLSYRERFAKRTDGKRRHTTRHDLLEMLSDREGIRKRPAMYFGNDPSASHIWSMMSGFRWAEIDECGEQGQASAFLTQFQSWIEERFPFSKGIPWHRTLFFVSLGSSSRSLGTFFDCFDLFRSGEASDSPSRAARIMMESISEEFECDPSDMTDVIKRIAPI